MKLLSALFISVLLFSCVKPRNCECTTTFPGGEVVKETHTVSAQNKDKSAAACEAENYSGDEFIKTCKLTK
jgi:hypothetical protein